MACCNGTCGCGKECSRADDHGGKCDCKSDNCFAASQKLGPVFPKQAFKPCEKSCECGQICSLAAGHEKESPVCDCTAVGSCILKRPLTCDPDMDKILRSCIKILRVKGDDYTVGSKDRLHNFKTVGAFTGQTMETTLGVYFYKHVAAVFNYIKNGGKSESEPIEGRIADCINYMLLFGKMVAERKRESAPF